MEINDDIVTEQAQNLLKQKKYHVQVDAYDEETLVSLAANMQAMSENIRLKNCFHINKLQRMRGSKAFPSLVKLVEIGVRRSSVLLNPQNQPSKQETSSAPGAQMAGAE